MNELTPQGDPIGPLVSGWSPPPVPAHGVMDGQYCRLEPLRMEHAPALFLAFEQDRTGRTWTYMPNGPFADLAAYETWLRTAIATDDPMHFAILVEGEPVGTASYLRITPKAGTIEVGYISYSPRLKRSRSATEAMYLMMRGAFTAGYRRYEWKCNALNAASRRAALRLGLSFEGVFRQASVVKGRNRDTAWYAAIDAEWPMLDAAFTRWLDPGNFDAKGMQRMALSTLTRPILVKEG